MSCPSGHAWSPEESPGTQAISSSSGHRNIDSSKESKGLYKCGYREMPAEVEVWTFVAERILRP
jgi:hypothetical protein